MNKLYLTCPRGLEEILKDELREIIKAKILIKKGGVAFNGNKKDMYKVNYLTRIGMNLLSLLFEKNISDYDSIYQTVYNYNWSKIISKDNTFSIKTKINSNTIQNQNFCTLRIKDAIVDRIRKDTGIRPSIDRKNPNFYITAYIKKNKIQLYLNSSGKPLFMRGYRSVIHKASLNESLASGILRLTNWHKNKSLYDPMCGSGTFLIEAAMSAFNMPPRILRKNYSFQNWKDFDSSLWDKIVNKYNNLIKLCDVNIYGSDILRNNIILSSDSMKKLNIDTYIKLQKADFKTIIPNQDNGVFLTNPPYGYRIGNIDKLKILYKEIGDHLKTNFQGYDGYIFTGNLELLKSVGLRTKRKIILKNGKIDCRLAYYPLQSGKY